MDDNNKPNFRKRPVDAPDKKNVAEQSADFREDIREDLEKIYADSDIGELDRLDQAHHSVFRRILLGLMAFLTVLTAVSWLGFFFFSPQDTGFGGEGVKVTIEGTDSPKSGETVEYLFRWENGETLALGTARLEIRIPRSFHVLESQALPEGETATWKIGSIGSGKRGSLSMKGYFETEVGRQMDIQAILTYRPANFNSEFQRVATKTVTADGTVIETEPQETVRVLPGDTMTTEIRFRNASETSLDGVIARLNLPDDFILESSEPPVGESGDLEWSWTGFGGGETRSIRLVGSFAPGAEGHREVTASIGLIGEGGEYLHQIDAANSAEVFRGDLITALIMNGQTADHPVRFGDKMRLTATWKNTGTLPIEDVRLTAVVESDPASGIIDWNRLEDKAGGIFDDGKVTWTKKQIPALAVIEPGDEGAMEFSFPLTVTPNAEAGTDDYRVRAHLESVARSFGGEEVNRAIKTSPITARLVSDTTLLAEARYFDDDNQPVGSGPLPPKVGEKTTYRIYWKIDNSFHELSTLKMTTKLPDNVSWTGFSEVDAGELRFDASSGKLVWTLNRMPTSAKRLIIAFDIDLMPTEQQKGRLASLIDATILEAIDTLTGAPMIVTASPLTTALASDDAAIGKSKVE